MAKSGCPEFNFTFDEAAASFTTSPAAYIAAHVSQDFEHIATGALVFDMVDPDQPPRILLLQRAATDSMPNRWEIPGGACDDDDKSVLHAAARELWEEAGLEARHISAPIGLPHVFLTRSGKRVGRFNFIVQVATKNGDGDAARLNVVLTPDEHQNATWATESEVRSGRTKDIILHFTTKAQKEVILLAFEALVNI